MRRLTSRYGFIWLFGSNYPCLEYISMVPKVLEPVLLYIEPSPTESEKEERNERQKKCPNTHSHLLQAQ